MPEEQITIDEDYEITDDLPIEDESIEELEELVQDGAHDDVVEDADGNTLVIDRDDSGDDVFASTVDGGTDEADTPNDESQGWEIHEPDQINDNIASLDTNVDVRAGDKVAIMLVNNVPTVIGVVGGGDRTFRDISNIQDAAKEASAAAESAQRGADAASELATAALNGGYLVITSTNGQLFKNGAESTVLQLAVFPNGGARLDTIEQVRERFGAGAYIEWQWKHEDSGEWGTMLSGDSHISHGGMWLTVTPEDVATKTTFSASLNV